MLFDLAYLRFDRTAKAEFNSGFLFLTNTNNRIDFLSANLIKQFGQGIIPYGDGDVFGYSNFSMSESGIVTQEQVNLEFKSAFDLRTQHLRVFINFLWFIKDNSVGLYDIYGEIPQLNFVSRESKSIVNYNCNGEMEDVYFNQEEFDQVTEITLNYSKIAPPRTEIKNPIAVGHEKYEKTGKFVIPKTADNFNYNEQNSLERAFNFLVTARNQKYLVYRIAYFMPIFECLFTTDSSEIQTKMAYRAAFYIGETFEECESIFKTVLLGYNIRSKFLHGQKFSSEKEIEKTALIDLSRKIDDILRKVLVKAINKDYEIFIDYVKEDKDSFFNKLVFELPFERKYIKKSKK